MQPITAAVPKEMLPLGRKPILEHVLEELRESGISRTLFVLSAKNGVIRDYFGNGSQWGMTCDYIVKQDKHGPASSIVLAEDWTAGAPFLIALGDCIIQQRQAHGEGRESPTLRLLQAHRTTGATVSALVECLDASQIAGTVGRYTVLEALPPGHPRVMSPLPIHPRAFTPAMVEALPPDTQTLVAAARWVMSPTIFPYLRRALANVHDQVHIPAVVRTMAAEQGGIWAVPCLADEARYDLGLWDTYFSQQIQHMLLDKDHGQALIQDLNNLFARKIQPDPTSEA